jgi:hypothetical protein
MVLLGENMELKFRKLYANEIDVRLGTQKLENPQDKKSRIVGASYLLYKDARVDMSLLDEFVGPMNWQRTHEFKDGKLYCAVGIYDKDKSWVWKEDVGVESNEEAEKGQASDSFKRACFNWGIGRELYTAPFIWITPIDDKEDLRKVKFTVKEIEYDGNEISKLIIIDNKGVERYTFGCKKSTTKKKEEPKVEKSEQQEVKEPKRLATQEQIAQISSLGEPVVKWCLNRWKIEKIEDLAFEDAEALLKKYNERKGQ